MKSGYLASLYLKWYHGARHISDAQKDFDPSPNCGVCFPHVPDVLDFQGTSICGVQILTDMYIYYMCIHTLSALIS